MNRLLMAVVCCASLTAALRAQDSKDSKTAAAADSTAAAIVPDPRAAAFVIGPEDILDIQVWKNPDLSRTVPVRPDGKVSLPLVNDIQAAGLTPMQLREVIRKKLVAYIPKPEVSVIVTEMHSYAVSVLGEVKTAGRYELRSGATVLDVLAQAGGITEFAKRNGIFVLRSSAGVTRRIPFDYDQVIAAPSKRNLAVQPGDIVVVP